MEKVLMGDSIPVSRSLAAIYGDTGAKFIQQLHYWLHTNSGEVVDGVRWIYKTLENWASELGVGTGTIKRVKKRLLEDGVIKVERLKNHRYWQVNWYTLDYERLEMIQSNRSKCAGRLDHKDPIKTYNTLQKKKKPNKTSPTHRPVVPVVDNRGEENDPAPSQPLGEPISQTVRDTEAETAFREAREAGVQLNSKIKELILSKFSESGSAALGQIREAIEIAAAAPEVYPKTGKPTNRTGLFVSALKQGWLSNDREPLPASDPSRTPIPQQSKALEGFKEWYKAAKKAKVVLGYAHYIQNGEMLVQVHPGKPPSEPEQWDTWSNLQRLFPIKQLLQEVEAQQSQDKLSQADYLAESSLTYRGAEDW